MCAEKRDGESSGTSKLAILPSHFPVNAARLSFEILYRAPSSKNSFTNTPIRAPKIVPAAPINAFKRLDDIMCGFYSVLAPLGYLVVIATNRSTLPIHCQGSSDFIATPTATPEELWPIHVTLSGVSDAKKGTLFRTRPRLMCVAADWLARQR